jgi:beta-lactamase class D
MEIPEPMLLTVNGETFRARADADQPGAWHLHWVSGPTEGYGFTTRRSDHRWGSRAELEQAVRSFLDEIDPETGYMRD